MGSMQCDRDGCENVCCTRYSERFGYICHECFDALVAIGSLDVQGFMDSPKEAAMPPEVFQEMFPYS